MLYALLIGALVAADQALKLWIRGNLELGERIPFLPRLMDLTYVQNTGAAFSILQDHTWLLAIISLVTAAALAAALWRRVLRHPLGMLCLAVVLAGAVGNLIDRLFLGFVTDMFMTTFMNFAVFNIADICVVVGGIALVVYVALFYDRLEKREQP